MLCAVPSVSRWLPLFRSVWTTGGRLLCHWIVSIWEVGSCPAYVILNKTVALLHEWPVVWKTCKCRGIWHLWIDKKIREMPGKKSYLGKLFYCRCTDLTLYLAHIMSHICEIWRIFVWTDNKRVHQELRRAAAEVARLQKKTRKGQTLSCADYWKLRMPFFCLYTVG